MLTTMCFQFIYHVEYLSFLWMSFKGTEALWDEAFVHRMSWKQVMSLWNRCSLERYSIVLVIRYGDSVYMLEFMKLCYWSWSVVEFSMNRRSVNRGSWKLIITSWSRKNKADLMWTRLEHRSTINRSGIQQCD